MQIWSIEWEDKEHFKMKVVFEDTDLKTWEHFYYITTHSMATSSKSELWLVEKDINGVFETKAKFKWEKH